LGSGRRGLRVGAAGAAGGRSQEEQTHAPLPLPATMLLRSQVDLDRSGFLEYKEFAAILQ
jgi:hypothetical protein